jgi:hypothetical protein
MCVMVETNPQDNDMGIGIITDWDPFCTKDNVWQENIGRFKLNDPFYSVIKEDGTTAYIPQGKTLINSKKFILKKKHTSIILPGQIIGPDLTPTITNNIKIGIDFNTFNGTYYTANKKKQEKYPEDEDFKNHFYFLLI